MKRIFIALFYGFLAVTVVFAEGASIRSFVPAKANVGGFGCPSSGSCAEAYYWVIASNGTEFNLGLTTDAGAKASYATVLAALSAGKSIEIGYWSKDPSTLTNQINISNIKIWAIPNYVSILN